MSSFTTSKVSVVLKGPEDWDEWMLINNTMAGRGAVKHCIDVDSMVELEEPTRPVLPIHCQDTRSVHEGS